MKGWKVLQYFSMSNLKVHLKVLLLVISITLKYLYFTLYHCWKCTEISKSITFLNIFAYFVNQMLFLY